MTRLVPVLMAGGAGTRLWPVSRELVPKQFLAFGDDGLSLLQHTALRASRLEGAGPVLAIGGEAHRFILGEQLRQIGIEAPAILIEPEARSTAPAAAVAAHFVAERFGGDALVFLMAADHAIADPVAFGAAVAIGVEAAREGRIALFGIRPTRPESGYGYVLAEIHSDPISSATLEPRTKIGSESISRPWLDVAGFVEKPPDERARQLVADGNCFWNGGMFLARADTWLAELRAFEPATHDAARDSLVHARGDIDFLRLDAAAFRGCANASIDVAVMERSSKLALVPLDAGWDDVGTWDYLGRLPATDADGNRVRGDVLLEDSRDNLVHATGRLVALLGVSGQVVVETEDAVLVASRDRTADVRRIVHRLAAAGRAEGKALRRSWRPWGSVEAIVDGARFQVRRLVVKPGGRLSLQRHRHRAEHWVVVEGVARVTCGESVRTLTEDQSTYIPLGESHRLENLEGVPLVVIEVRTGGVLSEDDIERLDDAYGR